MIKRCWFYQGRHRKDLGGGFVSAEESPYGIFVTIWRVYADGWDAPHEVFVFTSLENF